MSIELTNSSNKDKGPAYDSSSPHEHKTSEVQSVTQDWPHSDVSLHFYSLRSVLAIAGSALAQFCTIGFMNAYGVFQQYYTAHYLPTYTNFQISWIGSFASFTVFACAPLAGLLTDHYGPTIPTLAGTILQILAILLVSFCRAYYQFFLVQGILLGAGMSFIVIATSTVVPMYFERHRSLAQGISIAGASVGGIVWPIALDQMLNKDHISFGWAMRFIGFGMILPLGVVLLSVRKPVSVTATTTATSIFSSLKADITSSLSSSSSSSMMMPHQEKQQKTPPKPKTKKHKKDYSALQQPPFILLCLGLALAYLGFFVPLFYISVWATSLNFSEHFAFYLISILNGSSLFGRILTGSIADNYGPFNTIALAALVSGVVAFCWTEATSTGGLVVWTVAYGFTSGALLTLQLACAMSLVSEEVRGAAIGVKMGSVSLTGLFGTPIAGQLAESGYLSLSFFSGATLMAGGVLLWAARMALSRHLLAKV